MQQVGQLGGLKAGEQCVSVEVGQQELGEGTASKPGGARGCSGRNEEGKKSQRPKGRSKSTSITKGRSKEPSGVFGQGWD